MGVNAKIVLFAILVLAVFFRFYDLKNVPPGLYPDEAMNGNNALEAIAHKDWKIFYPENNGREGLFINIQSAFIYFLGNKPWVLRLPSAIFGTLTVLGLYFLSKLLFAERIALLASFFLAASFWHINFSRIGFRAIMAPFFLVWALYFLLRFYKNEGSNFSQTLSAVFGGIFFGLGFHTYIAYRIVPPLLLTLLLSPDALRGRGSALATGERRSCFPCILALFLFFAFIAALPLGIYYLQNPQDFFGRTAQISIFSLPAQAGEASPLGALSENVVKTAGMFWFVGDFNWRHNFSGAAQLWWPVGVFFAVGLLTARNLFLFSWLFLGLLPVVISSEGLPHALRAIIVLPPIMILAALGANFVLEKIRKELALALLLVLAISLPLWTYNQYFLRWAERPETRDAFAEKYSQLASYLNSLPLQTPKYVLVNAPGAEVRGIPMPAQSVMFLTDTFLPEKQKAKNIFY
ncbi:MAG: glycosyltransferase family 39 protein, partial [bacterium]|nr:glycosyltransferase family 39 protein [bacterium]